MSSTSWSWIVMTQKEEVMAERIVECMSIKRNGELSEDRGLEAFWKVRQIIGLSTILEGLKINYTRRGINIDTGELVDWSGEGGLNKIKTMLNQGLIPIEMLGVLKTYPGMYWNKKEEVLDLSWNDLGVEQWGYSTMHWGVWAMEALKMEVLSQRIKKEPKWKEGSRIIKGWNEAFEEPCVQVRENHWKKAYAWIERLECELGDVLK